MGKPSIIKPTPKKNGTTTKKPKAKLVGCESYRSLISKYDWNVTIAMAVMQAESGCRPDAKNVNYNGTTDVGLFQINSIHVASGLISDKGRLDPAKNIKAAYAIYSAIHGGVKVGWNAWAAFNNGSYEKFL